MREPRALEPARLTGGGAMLLLTDASGGEYAVPVDARLRSLLALPASSAASGSPAGASSPGHRQKEPTVPTPSDATPLRPKEIQDRVRAGESPETLAEATGTPVAKVLAFAGPVLAERAHVARTALGASVRRSPESAAGPARTLGDASTARAVEAGIDTESVDWDAWRREDGRWTLSAAFAVDDDDRVGRFSFDHRGRFVTPLDDAARWLVGEVPLSPPAVPEPVEEPVAATPVEVDPALGGPRRLRLAPAPELPETSAAVSAPAPAVRPDPEPAPSGAPAAQDAQGEDDALDMLFDHPAPQPRDGADAQDREDTAGLARRHPRKQRGRASVPSWDEIMFGGRD